VSLAIATRPTPAITAGDAGIAEIDAPQMSFSATRRLVLKLRHSRRSFANPANGFESHGYLSQDVLRALRLTFLFGALTATPCFAEDANNTGAGPVATVNIDHSTFIPSEITVAPGTTVTWVNIETMPHTVVDTNKAFKSKTLVRDGRFSFTFTTAGDFDYLCSIHPNMKGKVIVKPGAG
jgi:plastocyanin